MQASWELVQKEQIAVDSTALRLHEVSKCYRRFRRQIDRIRQWFSPPGKKFYEEHWALRDIHLTIRRGSTVGILGANGSGKSTLLQLIAGTLCPTTGTIAVHGRIAALLELGSGFHPEYTGMENIRLQGCLLGLSAEEVDEKSESITRFSELGDALFQPIRTYSSGMILRLGFSIAINLEPDVLLVDEALAVGDITFQQKCIARIQGLREQGVTIVLVTHDIGITKRLCDEAHVLHQGRLLQSGKTAPVCNWYVAHLYADRQQDIPPPDENTYRHGNQFARIAKYCWLNAEQKPTTHAWIGEEQTLEVHLEFPHPVDQPVLGFYLRDAIGTEILGENTHNAKIPLEGKQNTKRVVRFRFGLHLRPGAYTLCLGLVDNPHQPVVLDWIDQAFVLEVHDKIPGRVIYGLVAEPVKVTVD
ncbi:MAG TPA: ABC transporter ATP-binding protein [Gemmatales bacterium]|nr:ABC transporter ATP-binding protein [Gemmatales bacterium]